MHHFCPKAMWQTDGRITPLFNAPTPSVAGGYGGIIITECMSDNNKITANNSTRQ